jgi:hypothetical protein
VKIVLTGMEDVERQMARIKRGTEALGEHEAYIYSKLPYAYGQEEGRHKVSNKLARRSGGSYYMRRAVDEVLADADRDISEGLTKVTAPGVWILRRLALWSRRKARQNAPRSKGVKSKTGRNYRLWRSIKSEVRKK